MLIRLLIALGLGMAAAPAAPLAVRVGYFPNVTHAQGVIGSHTSRRKEGWFETRLGADVSLRWLPFNAGPSAIEGIFAGSVDLTYVGPNPALNGYIRSEGEEIRIIAGAAEGGAALVVTGNSGISKPTDFRGRRVGTPQLGNTQDDAARSWLRAQGFKVTLTGGDVSVLPAANPDLLQLFTQRRIDAAWTVEPWVSRLEQEAGGRVFLEQNDAITTVLVASARFLSRHPAIAERFQRAHVELTAWINAHPGEAMELTRAGLTAEIRREVAPALIASAWKRLRFTAEVEPARFAALVEDARSVGLLRRSIPLERLFPKDS
ncbi:MAG: ABC transporter substrate-binding protein [Opitutaceae bacterium]